MSENPHAFPTVECVHVVALTFVVGSIAMVDLRLLGILAKDQPVSHYSHELLSWTWGAFVVAAITGLLLFSSAICGYLANPAFLAKVALRVCAGLNMMVFQFVTWKGVSEWDHAVRAPTAARVAGALSLAFWIGIVVFGRWISFIDSGPFA